MMPNTIHQLNAESGARAYAEAPEYNRKKADKYLFIVNATLGMNTSEIRAWIDDWNADRPDNRISEQTVWRARRTVREGGPTSCLARYGGNLGKTTVSDEAFEYFKGLYLSESRPSAESCWEQTRAKFNPEVEPLSNHEDTDFEDDEQESKPLFPRAFEVRAPGDSEKYVFRGKRLTEISLSDGVLIRLVPAGVVTLPDSDPVVAGLLTVGMLEKAGPGLRRRGKKP